MEITVLLYHTLVLEQNCFYAKMGNNSCVSFVLRTNMSGFYRMAMVGTILTGSGWRYVFISNLGSI